MKHVLGKHFYSYNAQRSVFLTIWHCNLSAELTHSF